VLSLLRNGAPPLVIAHRGASAHAPENTMAAFSAAWAAGASWVEADTQPTVDAVAVVLHDDDLDRTTTGTGPVRETTARAVAGLDAGRWFGPQFAGERVPELGTLLADLTDDRSLLLEIKGAHTDDNLSALCDAVRGGRHDDRVFFESFETDELRRLTGLWTGRPFGLLAHELDADPAATALSLGAAAYNPEVGALLARPGVVAQLHAVGVAVMVWTSDDPRQWTALTDLGVDAIITNTPGELLAWQSTRGGR